jgi:chromosome partitioning protein
MDPPHGMVMAAANCMVIPVPPSLVDFASTVSFIDMTRTTMKQLEQLAGGEGRPTTSSGWSAAAWTSKSMHREILSMMRRSSVAQ